MELLDEGPGFDRPLPRQADQRQRRIAAFPDQRAASHGGEEPLPRRANLRRATLFGRLRGDDEVWCVDIEAFALRAFAGRLV